MFERLKPKTEWKGGRITDMDRIRLDEAARMASIHAKTEVTVSDILRAAKREEIRLEVIVSRGVLMKKNRNYVATAQSLSGEAVK